MEQAHQELRLSGVRLWVWIPEPKATPEPKRTRMCVTDSCPESANEEERTSPVS